MTASAHKRRTILRATKRPDPVPDKLSGLFAIGTPAANPQRMAEALKARTVEGDRK